MHGLLQATDPEVGTLLGQLGDAQDLGAFDAAVVRETRRSDPILHMSLCSLSPLLYTRCCNCCCLPVEIYDICAFAQ